MKWLARVLAAIALAAFASAFSGDLPNSPYTDIAVATADLVGLLLLGWYARWSSLWIFSIALVAVTAVHERFVWDDDPHRSGMDDIGPTGLVLALPVAWVVLAVGAAARHMWSAQGWRRTHRPSAPWVASRRAALRPRHADPAPQRARVDRHGRGRGGRLGLGDGDGGGDGGGGGGDGGGD